MLKEIKFDYAMAWLLRNHPGLFEELAGELEGRSFEEVLASAKKEGYFSDGLLEKYGSSMESMRLNEQIIDLAREFLDAIERETGEEESRVTLFGGDSLREMGITVDIRLEKGIDRIWGKDQAD